MRISLIAVGERMPGWVEKGVNEYRRRLPTAWQFQLIEVPLAPRGKNADIARLRAREGGKVLAAVPAGDQIVALEIDGRALATEKLAGYLAEREMEGQSVSLLIGGPDGLDAACREAANWCWSLSPLTLPHPLVRVVVVEQLYRAWSINSYHPYHR